MNDLLLDLCAEHGLDVQYASGGAEIMLACPLCADHKPRLYINRRTFRWICFNCDMTGAIDSFLENVLGYDPFEAYHIKQKLKGPVRWERTSSVGSGAPDPEVPLPPEAMPLDNPADPLQKPYWDYLTRRGLAPELVIEYGLHFALTGKHGQRGIVPIKENGILKGWIARAIINNSDDPKWAKVLTAPGMKTSRVLFNLDKVRGQEEAILVEGVFDALALPTRAIATLGAKLSPIQRHQLRKAGFTRIVLMWDPDTAGERGARKAGPELAAAGFEVAVATLPKGVDPGSASSVVVKEALGNAKPIELDLRYRIGTGEA